MDDEITDQAAKNVLSLEQFGSGNNETAKTKYKIFKNDCNDFTKAVLKEYKKLWIENYKEKNSNASKLDILLSWKQHYDDISKRNGEKYEMSE